MKNESKYYPFDMKMYIYFIFSGSYDVKISFGLIPIHTFAVFIVLNVIIAKN